MKEKLLNDLVEVWNTLSGDEIGDIAKVGKYDLKKDYNDTESLIEKSLIICMRQKQLNIAEESQREI